MELLSIGKEIHKKILQLEELRLKLPETAQAKAVASSEYEVELAKAVMALRNGKTITLGDESITNPPTTIMKEIAKGACSKVALQRDVAESKYKNLITIIDLIKAQLNGYQSIYKNLTEV